MAPQTGTASTKGKAETASTLTGTLAKLDLTAHEKDPPRSNFPLPRELRDRVYDFLLDGKEVKAAPFKHRLELHTSAAKGRKRHASLANTYRFHTKILSANKAIAEEASEALYYRNNHFVLITHKWPSLVERKHADNIPIVCDGLPGILPKKISLRVSLHHPNAAGTDWPICHFIMLWRDFTKFMTLLQWLFFELPAPIDLWIDAPGTGQPTRFALSLQSYHLPTVRTGLTFASLYTHRNKKFFLDACTTLKGLVIPGHEVSIITNPPGRAELKEAKEHLSSTMGRRKAKASVMLWHIVDTARTLKASADDMLASGHRDGRWHYGNILYPSKRWAILEHINAIRQDQQASNALAVLILLILDVAVTIARSFTRKYDYSNLQCVAVGITPLMQLLESLNVPQMFPEGYSEFMRYHPIMYILGLQMVLNGDMMRVPNVLGQFGGLSNICMWLKEQVEARPTDASMKQDYDFFHMVSSSDTVSLSNLAA